MKSLGLGDYLIRPFKVYKQHSYSYLYLNGSNISFIQVDEALPPPSNWISMNFSDPQNPNGIGKIGLYNSIIQMFYPSMSLSGGIVTSGSFSRPPSFPRRWGPTANPSGSFIIGVSSLVFGEQIRPGSFVVTTTSGTASLKDDGNGCLYSDSNSGSIIGNIFYPLGIAIIGKMSITSSLTGSVITDQGLYLTTGSQLTVNYQSQVTFYEHSIICTLEKNEFNFSVNPSLSLFSTSSVSGSVKMVDAMSSGSLTPYITTIGLYDETKSLLAIAKVPNPLKRAPEIDQTFIVKLDIM